MLPAGPAGDVLGGCVHDLVGRLAHPPGNDPGRPGQDLGRQRRLGGQEPADIRPGEDKGEGRLLRPGGGRVRIIVHQGPFPEEIEPAEPGQLLFLAQGGFLIKTNRPLVNQEEAFPGLVFLEEGLAGLIGDKLQPGRDGFPLGRGQVGKKLDGSQKPIDFRRGEGGDNGTRHDRTPYFSSGTRSRLCGYPNPISRIIIRTNPAIVPKVAISACSPTWDSGMTSSTTT